MGIFYQMSGTVKVRNVPEVKAIVDRFNDESAPDLTMSLYDQDWEHPLVTMVRIEGCLYTSYETANTLDEIVRELCEFAEEGVNVVTNFDGDEIPLYVGPPGTEIPASSRTALADASRLIASLLPDDALTLMELLVPRLDDKGRARMNHIFGE